MHPSMWTIARRGATAALLAGLAGANGVALADPPPEATALDEIVVTGTRLAQPALSSISPVSVIQADVIQQRGITNVEELLNQMPQFTADQSAGLSQGGTGVANLNLRGLGSQRTLVLINGRRLMPGDPTSAGNGAADVNNIPAELVKRVEVLTGGASATYGADAVAGVVNFIIDDHFQGVKLDLDYGLNYHDNSNAAYFNGLLAQQGFGPTAASGTITDGRRKGFTLTAGTDLAGGSGNVTGYFSYHEQAAVLGNSRDYNACTVGAGPGGFSCLGSPNAYPTVIAGNDGNLYQLAQDGSSFNSLYQLYNYGPDHYFQRPDTRYNAGVFAHLSVTDDVEAYTELSYMHDFTRAQYARTALFFGSGLAKDPTLGVTDGNFYVNCGTGLGSAGANPFLNATLYSQLCDPTSTLGSLLIASQQAVNGNQLSQLALALRAVEGPPRYDDYTHDSYRAVLGLRGKINDVTNFDVYAMEGRTDYHTEHYNDFLANNAQNALLVVNDPASGQPVCLANAGGQNGAPGCVPYNAWLPGYSGNAAAIKYISATVDQSGRTTEQVASANLTLDAGALGARLPTAKDGLGVNVGAEWRRETLELYVDPALIQGLVTGDGIVEPTSGSYSVWEVFTEARLPLVQEAQLAKELTADAGYRFSHYTEGFDTSTYKMGLQWAPVEDLRLRSSLQHAVRAPNVQELYQPAHVGLDGANDYCANGNSPFYTAAQCANTGVSAAQYGTIVANPGVQYNGLLGGNPQLKPESARTVSFGVILTPKELPGFTATIDYYDIRIDNLISTYGGDFILGQCALTGNPYYCNLVKRAPNGSLWLSPAGYVIDTNVNAGSERTSGIDVELHQLVHLGRAGELRASLTGTYLSKWEVTPPDNSSYDCAGLYGPICGPPLPKWRHTLTLDWQTPIDALSLQLSWRYVDAVKVEYTSAQMADAGVDPTYSDIRLSSASYFDLSGSYVWDKVTLRLGINNLFDKNPPLVGTDEIGNGIFGENNTYPQLYDTMGRYVHLGLTAKF